MKQRVLIPPKPVKIRCNEHLIVEAVDSIIQRDLMKSYLNARVRK